MFDKVFGVIDSAEGYAFIAGDEESYWLLPASPSQTWGAGDAWAAADGQWHHFAIQLVAYNTSNYVVRLAFDGQQQSWVGPGAPKSIGINSIHADARSMYGNAQSKISVARMAFYNRELSAAEILDHYRRGVGWAGEDIAARLTRYLASWWAGPYTVGASSGLALAADHGYDGSTLLAALTDILQTDHGLLWVDGAGVVQAETRRVRQLASTAPVATFGEQPGEQPYVSLPYDFDPTWVYSETSLSRPGRSGPLLETNATTEAEVGQRTFSRTLQVTSDFDLEQAGVFFRTRYATPRLRITELELDPASNPELWSFVLSAEISQRVTVHRRTSAGTTITGDFYVESIKEAVDIGASTWRAVYELSPVFVPQSWILGDATRGVLGSTTIPVY